MTAYFLGLVPLVLLSGYCGLSAIFKAELYPVHVRALGVAVPYAIAQAIFGGNAETTALYLKQIGHEAAYFWLVSGMMMVGILATLRLRETRDHSLIHQEHERAVEQSFDVTSPTQSGRRRHRGDFADYWLVFLALLEHTSNGPDQLLVLALLGARKAGTLLARSGELGRVGLVSDRENGG